MALNTPVVRRSATRTVHSARSRTSMNCTRSLPSPGARISRCHGPAARGQYVKSGSVSSPGPTTRPGRMMVLAAAPDLGLRLLSLCAFSGP